MPPLAPREGLEGPESFPQGDGWGEGGGEALPTSTPPTCPFHGSP